MAKKNVRPSEQPEKAVLVIPKEEAKRKLQVQIDKGKDFLAHPIRDTTEMEETEQEYFRWDEFNYELLNMMFSTNYYALQYRGFGGGGGVPRTPQEQIDNFHRDVKYYVNHLESLNGRLELIPEDPGITRSVTVSETKLMKSSNKVFVVHGHDDAAKVDVARFLEKLGLDAIILHERSDLGQTIIEKFEHNSDVGFAVVLLTPDDVGASKKDYETKNEEALKDRARQNVIFELGFFMAKLGRVRVRALMKGSVDILSDVQGVIYTPIDTHGAWRFKLAKEMSDSGMDVDLTKAY